MPILQSNRAIAEWGVAVDWYNVLKAQLVCQRADCTSLGQEVTKTGIPPAEIDRIRRWWG